MSCNWRDEETSQKRVLWFAIVLTVAEIWLLYSTPSLPNARPRDFNQRLAGVLLVIFPAPLAVNRLLVGCAYGLLAGRDF